MSYYGPNIARCQHIKVNGIQCGSPAVKRNRFCFFHKRWHEQRIVINSARARKTRAALDLPVLEDANSIQVALMQVMGLLLRGQLDAKTAGMLLYGLQTASCNLRHTSFEHMIKTRFVIDPSRVAETELGADPWSEEDFYEEEEQDEESEAPTPAARNKEEDELVEVLDAANRRKPAMKDPPSNEAIRAQIRRTVINILPEAKRALEDAAPACSVAIAAPPAKPAAAPVKTEPAGKRETRALENLSLVAAVMKNAAQGNAAHGKKSPAHEQFFSLPRDPQRNSPFVQNGTGGKAW